MFRISSFSADVTIPLNHRCMGLLPTKSKEIVDPLQAHGFVFQGAGQPIVFCAVDWCEIRNEAYDRWRDVIAKSVGTSRERVLVTSLHQHDAPVSDIGAQNLLDKVGLHGELFDFAFHEKCVQNVAAEAKDSMESAVEVTHIGTGEARVSQVASNRRIIYENGRVSYSRGSRSGSNKFLAEAPDGLIDPNLKTISFWNNDQPLVALHGYATHPMSYYGRGGVSYDFVGMARERRRRDDPKVAQIYASGCSGDVTAGKYNDGSHETRKLLAQRIHAGMVAAWKSTKRVPLNQVDFRNTKLTLPFRTEEQFTAEALYAKLNDPKLDVIKRIHAAMTLSSRMRVVSGNPIDLPVVDFGAAQLVLFPGEAFVEYQLMAQKIAKPGFVLSVGYGECWPGYIPTQSNFDDKFDDTWLWVGPGSDKAIQKALKKVLRAQHESV